jgi:hypothetical protein
MYCFGYKFNRLAMAGIPGTSIVWYSFIGCIVPAARGNFSKHIA